MSGNINLINANGILAFMAYCYFIARFITTCRQLGVTDSHKIRTGPHATASTAVDHAIILTITRAIKRCDPLPDNLGVTNFGKKNQHRDKQLIS
jgi:hypothetical protein